eukprot:Tbor_TRINITY_DN4953_c2_g4::TRINITY_DN4953_c2_g4_i1::g.9783::m.9783
MSGSSYKIVTEMDPIEKEEKILEETICRETSSILESTPLGISNSCSRSPFLGGSKQKPNLEGVGGGTWQSIPTLYSHQTIPQGKEPACALLLQLTSAGPTLKAAVPKEPSRRLLNPSQESWVVHFFAKDLLNLENIGQRQQAQTVSNTSFLHSRGATSGASGGSGNTSGCDTQWIKVVEIPQLVISTVALYFIMIDAEEQRHSFACVLLTQTTPLFKIVLPTICDRLDNMYRRVTAIFEGNYEKDSPPGMAPALSSITEEDITQKTTTNSAGNQGGRASLNGIINNAEKTYEKYKTVDSCVWGGALGNDVPPSHTASDDVAPVVIGEGSPADVLCSSSNSSHAISDKGNTAARRPLGIPVLSSKISLIVLEKHAKIDDCCYYDNMRCCGYDDLDHLEYHEIWEWEMRAAARDFGFWVSCAVDRSKIDVTSTIASYIATISLAEGLHNQQQTVVNVRSSTVSLNTLGMRDLAKFIITLSLSEHRLIISGSNAHEINEWLSTVCLFLPDDRLFLACRKCFLDFVVPDLNIQGTTLGIDDIKKRLVWFRYPTAIVRIDKMMDVIYQTCAPMLRALTCMSSNVAPLGGTGVPSCDSECNPSGSDQTAQLIILLPRRNAGRKEYDNFRDWRSKQIQQPNINIPISFLVKLCVSNLNITKTITSGIVESICNKIFNIIEINAEFFIVASLKNGNRLFTTQSIRDIANQQDDDVITNSTTVDFTIRPISQELEYKEHLTEKIMFMLSQWRRTLMMRAINLFLSEVYLRAREELPMIFQRLDGDQHVLLATIESAMALGSFIADRDSHRVVNALRF